MFNSFWFKYHIKTFRQPYDTFTFSYSFYLLTLRHMNYMIKFIDFMMQHFLQCVIHNMLFHLILTLDRQIMQTWNHDSLVEPFTLREFHTVKNWYQFLTTREKMVPIRHVFHTNISLFVKNAQEVELYEAYLRILYIDKKTPNLHHFASKEYWVRDFRPLAGYGLLPPQGKLCRPYFS